MNAAFCGIRRRFGLVLDRREGAERVVEVDDLARADRERVVVGVLVGGVCGDVHDVYDVAGIRDALSFRRAGERAADRCADAVRAVRQWRWRFSTS